MTRLEQRARELADLVCDPRGDGDHAVLPDEIADAMVKLAREFAADALAWHLYDYEGPDPENHPQYIEAAIAAAEDSE